MELAAEAHPLEQGGAGAGRELQPFIIGDQNIIESAKPQPDLRQHGRVEPASENGVPVSTAAECFSRFIVELGQALLGEPVADGDRRHLGRTLVARRSVVLDQLSARSFDRELVVAG